MAANPRKKTTGTGRRRASTVKDLPLSRGRRGAAARVKGGAVKRGGRRAGCDPMI